MAIYHASSIIFFEKGIIKMIITLLPERFKVIDVEDSQYIFSAIHFCIYKPITYECGMEFFN